MSADQPSATQTPTPSHRTDCIVVGGGPAGMILALLLLRKGLAVTVLEAHTDFDRDFRGDTLHPSVMELMDELGLAQRLLELPHTKLRTVTLPTPQGPLTLEPFIGIKTSFPYITMMPQVEFLQFVAAEAQRFPKFRLLMGARVEELIEEQGVVQGVRYRTDGVWGEVRALLTVGADGRFSRVRRLAGLEAVKAAPPMDVLWFRVPRLPGDAEEVMGRFGKGQMAIMLNRFDSWQVGYIILKNSYAQIREAGLPALRAALTEMLPQFKERWEHLQSWKQVSLLSVEADRVRRWYRPGLLVIGDAAHTMSPAFGIGINFAIQDAVVAANMLTLPLLRHDVTEADLRAVQRRREWPTRIVQALQSFGQRQLVTRTLESSATFRGPQVVRLLSHVPLLRALPGRFLAYGIWPVHIQTSTRRRLRWA